MKYTCEAEYKWEKLDYETGKENEYMKNLLGNYVTAVQKATDINDHTGAIVLMAQYVAKKHNRLEGVDKLIKSAQAVETLHDFYGHMPDYLNKIRDEVAARCESFMSAEEVKAFHGAR